MPPSKVELYAAIRRDARAGMSGRAIEKKYRVGRRTIVRALSSAWPEPRRQLPPRASRLGPFKPVIDEILKADLDAPRKQRHTITRIYHRLLDEHGMADVSRGPGADAGTGVWGLWMPGFMQFFAGVYLFAGLTLFDTFKTPALYMTPLAFTAYGVHWFALGWNRLQHADVRVNVGMSVAFLLLSILGIIVFFSVHDNPVGGLFIGLPGVYATEFFASMSTDQPRIGRLGERVLGIFRIGTGLWLTYLTFVAALNFILNYNLPL